MRYAAITDRLAGLGTDKWHVHYRARAKVEAGETVLMLSIGEPDADAPHAIAEEAARQLLAGRTRYSSGRGERNLLEAVAQHYSDRTGRPVTPEQVVFLPGTQSALFAAIMAVAQTGDEVIVPEPFYVTYDGLVASAGGTQIGVHTRPENGFHLTPAQLESVVSERSRVLILNSPSNPTGAVLSREEIAAIGRVAQERDLWIISDEVYSSLVFGNSTFASPFDDADLAERTIVVSSLSKSHAMTGYRAGWVVASEEFCTRMLPIAEAMLFGCQPFIQDAAAFALSRDFPECAAMRTAYERRARIIVDAFAGCAGINCRMPEGGMFIFADVRPTGLSGEEFALGLLEAENVAVMPGEAFGSAGAGHVRIGLTVPDDQLGEAVARITRFAGRAALAGQAVSRQVGYLTA